MKSIPFVLVLLLPFRFADAEKPAKPNIVIIFIDDMGYGDLGCFGSKTIRTPRIDRLAAEGIRFTNFYAQTVCGPSRSALLTGRYPIRSGGWGVPTSEITIAELLKTAGYSTGIIGKWDVSNRRDVPGRVPNDQGFDYFWGTLGANDGGAVKLYDNRKAIGGDRNMATLTRRYTDKAIEFIRKNKEQPFLLYLAHTMVHVVVDATADFKGKSQNGLYGDTVEEIDFHTGRLLDELEALGLKENTLVLFTSDNGPWSNDQKNQRRKNRGALAWGSAGPLRGAKGSTYEGGIRVPAIARWPGKVAAGRTSEAIFSTLDFLPTFAGLAGIKVPSDRTIDGVDQTDLLTGKSEAGARDNFWYFNRKNLNGIRKGKWKLLLEKQVHHGYVDEKGSGKIELYDLESDISESKNVAAENPTIVEQLLKVAAAAQESVGADSQKTQKPKGSGIPSPQRKGHVYDNAKPAGNLRFDFETGELGNWKIVEGKLEVPVTNKAMFRNMRNTKWNKQGKYFLSTLERKSGKNDRTMIAVLESPVFKLSGDRMSFLVGGGGHANTYVALCDAESGKEHLKANGGNKEVMGRVEWDVKPYRGKRLFIRIVDRSKASWGHVTFDDFSTEGDLEE